MMGFGDRRTSSSNMKREGPFVICISNKGYSASLELRKI
jgi:hypothetical protein